MVRRSCDGHVKRKVSPATHLKGLLKGPLKEKSVKAVGCRDYEVEGGVFIRPLVSVKSEEDGLDQVMALR